MTAARTFWLIVGLVLLDAATKLVLPSGEPWMQHHRSGEWKALTLVWVLVPAYVCVRVPFLRFTAALLLAGIVGNWLSAVVVGYVPDPLLWTHGDSYTAFNMADVMLLTTFPALLVAFGGEAVKRIGSRSSAKS